MLELQHLNIHFGNGKTRNRLKPAGFFNRRSNSSANTQDGRQFRFNFNAHSGSTTAILGKSGAGKSTLLAAVGGYIQPQSGAIRWNREPIDHLPPDLRPVTSLFQSQNLFEHLNVEKNIGLGIDTKLKLDSSQQSLLLSVLEKVGLQGFEKRLPTELSGGEQQRVALARCLVRKQPVLLLDEPFSALDTTTRHEMLVLTKNIIASENLCTLLVTHNPEDAIALAANQITIANDQVDTGYNSG